jgi:hypothetical protein
MTELWDRYQFAWEFVEPILGTIPKHREVWSEHVRSSEAGLDEDEMMALADEAGATERGATGFYTDADGHPILFDYQIKGAFKEAGNTIKDVVKVKALRSHIEAELFVFPRITILAEKPDGYIERPLRAMTMQGPRVTVVRSDKVDPGQVYAVELRVLKGSRVTRPVLESITEYLAVKGLGQWRNGGYGRLNGRIEA